MYLSLIYFKSPKVALLVLREKRLPDFTGVAGRDFGGRSEERAETLGLNDLPFFLEWGVGRLLGKRGLTRVVLVGGGSLERELQLLEKVGGTDPPR